MPKELNPLLHSQLRLGVMSILMVKEEADFVYLKEKTESTAGNLSVHLPHHSRREGCFRRVCRYAKSVSALGITEEGAHAIFLVWKHRMHTLFYLCI